MRMMWQWIVAVVLGLSVSTSVALAGVEEARKYIDEAAELIKNGDNDKASTKLDLAEVELEGVDAATAGPLKTQIETLKKSMTSAADAEARTRLMRDVERGLRNTEESIGNINAFDSNADDLLELLKDTENARLIGTEDVAKYVKQVEAFKKVHAKKAVGVYAERIESRVKNLEDEWPEHKKELTEGSPAAQQSATRDVYNDIEQCRREIASLEEGTDKRKTFEARVAQIETEYNQLVGESQVAEYLQRMQDGWKSYEDEWKDWDAETPADFNSYMKVSSSEMYYYNLPKTAALINRAQQFEESYAAGKTYELVKGNEKVKAFIEGIRKQRQDAHAKALKAAVGAVEAAEKMEVTDDLVSSVNRLSGSGSRGTLHMLIGDESPELKGLVDRCNAIVAKREQAVAGAEKARDEAFAKLSAEAEKAWPAMVAKFDAQDSFDPDNPPVGKYVRFKDINNRMGWDYSSDDLNFASRVNGKPFAGRFDPVVSAAFKEVRDKVGGNKMEDNGWDVIGIVERGTVRMTQRVQSEVRDQSNSNIGSVQKWDPIDVPHIKIVAVRAGPVAVAVGSGAVKEDGKVEAPAEGAAGPTGGGGSAVALASTGGGAAAWLWIGLMLIIGLAAAAVCLAKANYAPLAAVPQAGQMQASLGGENLSVIGLICAIIGVVFLLRGMVVYGLFTNIAIIAAGLYAAMDWLQARGIIKPELVAQIRPFGVPIGWTCAALVIVKLLFSIIGLNLVVI